MGSGRTQQAKNRCLGTSEAHSNEAFPKSWAVNGLRHYSFGRERCPGGHPETVPLTAGSHATFGSCLARPAIASDHLRIGPRICGELTISRSGFQLWHRT